MERKWITGLRLVAFKDHTVKSIQTVWTSQPKIPV
jgi:hypothetical protein